MTFTLSIEETVGISKLHGFHLGTIESTARTICEEKLAARKEYGIPTVSLALIRNGKIFDVLYSDGTWNNDLGVE